jgi:hypothetical protein
MRRSSHKWRYLFCLIALVGLFISPWQTRAATVSSFSDQLSDSQPTALANHDIKIKMDSGTTIANGKTLAIKFTGFTVGSATLLQSDFTVNHSATGSGAYTALTATTHYTIATVSAGADPTVTITFTTAGATAISTDKYIEVVFANAANKLPNPAAGTYSIDINSSTFGDTGAVQVAIITGITTTATVSASLSVAVALIASGQTVNGATTNIAPTATTMPFSSLTVNTPKIGGQSLTVSTNAIGGYTTLIRALQGSGTNDVLADGSNNIDGFSNGSASNASPQAWAHPTGTAGNVNSGWYGYTTDDATLGTGTANRFTSVGNVWAPFSATGYEVSYSSSPVSSEVTKVGHQIEVNGLQPQGNYTGTVEYITTAVF